MNYTPATPQGVARPLLVLAVGAVCISFAAIFVKLVGQDHMGPTAIGFWRAFLGAAILFAWSRISCPSLKMSRRLMAWSVLAGFIFFLDLFFWHRSILYSGAGMATILANTQVFVVASLGWVVFKERPTLVFFAAAISAVAGVALLVGIGSNLEFSALYLAGIGYGLLTGLAYGSYLITMKNIGHRPDAPDFRVFMSWTSLFTAAFLAIAMLIEGEPMMLPGARSFVILLALALTAQVIGWWTITWSLPKIPAARSGLVLLLQPVLATIWGFLVFSERLTTIQIFGALITLAAIYTGSVRRSSEPVPDRDSRQ